MGDVEESRARDAQGGRAAFAWRDAHAVALVAKMRELGVVANESLTRAGDGKAYVTTERVREEVMREVERCGGRVGVVALSTALGVDASTCERAAKALARENASSGARFLEGELMTDGYFDDVARETQEILRENGTATVSDVARKFSLGADLVVKVLRERVVGASDVKMDGSLVYTSEYVAKLTSRVRETLMACAVPTSRDALLREALGEEARAQLVGSVLSEVIKSKAVRLSGEMSGGVWYPAAHLDRQRKKLLEMFAQMGVVSVDAAARVGFDAKQAKKILSEADESHLEFGSPACFVAKRVLDQFETAISEALDEDGYCYTPDVLPEGLTSCAETLAQTSVLQKHVEFGREYVVTKSFIKKCTDAIKRFGELAAEKAIRENEKKDVATLREFLVANSVGDSDVIAAVKRAVPGVEADLIQELVRVHKVVAVLAFKERISFAIASHGDKLRMSCDAAKKIFLASYPTALLCSKGTAEVLSHDSHAMTYTCRRYAVPCADAFLRSKAEKSFDEGDSAAPLTEKLRAFIVESFSDGNKAKALGRDLIDAIRREKSPMEVMDSLGRLCELFGVRLPAPNKKTERSMLHVHKKGLEEQLRAATDISKALLIVVPLLVAQTRGKVVAITGRSLGTALEACEGLEPERRTVVKAAITQVLDELTGASSSTSAIPIDIETLKAAALSGTSSRDD